MRPKPALINAETNMTKKSSGLSSTWEQQEFSTGSPDVHQLLLQGKIHFFHWIKYIPHIFNVFHIFEINVCLSDLHIIAIFYLCLIQCPGFCRGFTSLWQCLRGRWTGWHETTCVLLKSIFSLSSVTDRLCLSVTDGWQAHPEVTCLLPMTVVSKRSRMRPGHIQSQKTLMLPSVQWEKLVLKYASKTISHIKFLMLLLPSIQQHQPSH